MWIHFLIIDDHVTVPGTTRRHKCVPSESAGLSSDELTESIDGAKTSAWFSRTLEYQGRDGKIYARLDMGAQKSGGGTSVDEEWAANRIVEAGTDRCRVDRTRGTARYFKGRSIKSSRANVMCAEWWRFGISDGGVIDARGSDAGRRAGRAGLCSEV